MQLELVPSASFIHYFLAIQETSEIRPIAASVPGMGQGKCIVWHRSMAVDIQGCKRRQRSVSGEFDAQIFQQRHLGLFCSAESWRGIGVNIGTFQSRPVGRHLNLRSSRGTPNESKDTNSKIQENQFLESGRLSSENSRAIGILARGKKENTQLYEQAAKYSSRLQHSN